MEFLLVRIAEDEADARWAICPCGGPVCNVEQGWYRRGELRERLRDTDSGSDARPVGHVLRWSPARVLAECKAKRQIVNDADFAMLQAEINPRREGNEGIHAAALLAKHVLLNLAQVYLGHPDYSASWAL